MAYTSNPKAPKLRMAAVKLVRQGWSIRKVARHYGYAPSTVSRWVKKAPQDGRSVIPTESSRPHSHSKTTSPAVVSQIIQKRLETNRCCEVVHFLLGQDGVDVSLSTVKRWLGKTSLIKKKSKWKKYKKLIPRPDVNLPGDLVQIDTIHLDYNGTRYYVFTVLDVCSRWAYARFSYKCNTYEATKTIQLAQQAAPFLFRMIQSDHGPEFSRHFSKQLEAHNLKHRHSRVRTPNDNAHLERFNRTLQEECIYFLGWHPQPQAIIDAIPPYLFFYNHQRPHLSLNFLTPFTVLQSY